jgi:hypothetical protein
VVKRKMSNFPRKRDHDRRWPQPIKPPDQAVVIVTCTARTLTPTSAQRFEP